MHIGRILPSSSAVVRRVLAGTAAVVVLKANSGITVTGVSSRCGANVTWLRRGGVQTYARLVVRIRLAIRAIGYIQRLYGTDKIRTAIGKLLANIQLGRLGARKPEHVARTGMHLVVD